MFSYNTEGIKEQDYTPIPMGEYILEIVTAEEGLTKEHGHQKVTVGYKIAEGPYKDKDVNYHTITFFSDPTAKGAGIAKHYLKSIGEPYEGKIQVSANNWIGKLVRAKVIHEKGTMPNQVFAKVKSVSPFDGKLEANDESVPF